MGEMGLVGLGGFGGFFWGGLWDGLMLGYGWCFGIREMVCVVGYGVVDDLKGMRDVR